ncbi:hypothetical protein BKA69DRAFT_326515 [Paraphysoderma sedebokerense]|nr:hypothetical protein BKA69DRAFT_326515 [Paraphysoderma sedebokerense]
MSSHSTAPPLPKRSVRRSESKTSSVFSIPPSPNPTQPNSHPPTQLTCSTNTSTAFQQSKIKFSLATNTLNTICILIFVSANIVNLTITDVFSVVLVNVYGLVLGLVLLANEVKHHRIATEYFKFTTTWKDDLVFVTASKEY